VKVKPKGSTSGIQGLCQIESRNTNCMTFTATRCIFWALSASYLLPALCLKVRPSTSNFSPSGYTRAPETKSWLCPSVLSAIKIAVKGSASKKRMKNRWLFFWDT